MFSLATGKIELDWPEDRHVRPRYDLIEWGLSQIEAFRGLIEAG